MKYLNACNQLLERVTSEWDSDSWHVPLSKHANIEDLKNLFVDVQFEIINAKDLSSNSLTSKKLSIFLTKIIRMQDDTLLLFEHFEHFRFNYFYIKLQIVKRSYDEINKIFTEVGFSYDKIDYFSKVPVEMGFIIRYFWEKGIQDKNPFENHSYIEIINDPYALTILNEIPIVHQLIRRLQYLKFFIPSLHTILKEKTESTGFNVDFILRFEPTEKFPHFFSSLETFKLCELLMTKENFGHSHTNISFIYHTFCQKDYLNPNSPKKDFWEWVNEKGHDFSGAKSYGEIRKIREKKSMFQSCEKIIFGK